MKKNEHETSTKIRRGWIRIWAILIPTWIVSVVALWLFIDKFVFDDATGVANSIMIERDWNELPTMMPASGPEETPNPGLR